MSTSHRFRTTNSTGEQPVSGETVRDWQEVVDLVVGLAHARAALIMRVVADDIEVFVASRSEQNPFQVGEKGSLMVSGRFCERVIASQAPLLVSNATTSDAWRISADVTSRIISYLGVPLRWPTGEPFGTLCVLDDRENAYSPELTSLLLKMRDLIESRIQHTDQIWPQQLLARESLLRRLVDNFPASVGCSTLSADPRIIYLNEQFTRTFGYTIEDIPSVLDWMLRACPDSEYRQAVTTWWDVTVAAATTQRGTIEPREFRVTCKDGRVRDVLISATVLESILLVTFLDFTARKQAEEDLAVNEARYRMALELNNDSVWEWDIETGEVTTNGRWFAMYGYQPGEIATSYAVWKSHVHPDDVQSVLRVLDDYWQGHTPLYSSQYRVITRSGEVRWTRSTGRTVARDAEGKPLRMIGTDSDITERVAAEHRVQETLRLLQVATRTANIGIWSWEFATGRLEWDKRLCDWYEVPDDIRHGGLFYAFWTSRLHPDDRGRAEAVLSAAVRDNTAYEDTFRLLLPDGRIRYIQTSADLERDAEGKPWRMIGVNRDVTEQRAQESNLRESEERFRLAFENANTGMCLVEPQGRLLQVNGKMCEILGYSRQELEDMTVNDLTLPEDRNLSPAYIDRAMNGGADSATFEKRYRHRHGQVIYAQVASTLVREAQGNPRYFISQVQDITDRKQAEAALHKEQAFSQTVIDSIPGIFYVFDEDGRFVRWNNFQRDSVMGPPDEHGVTRIRALDTVHPDDRAFIGARVADLFATGNDQTVAGRVLLRGGPEFRWFLMNGQRLVIDGQPYLVGTGVDITAQKQAELAVEESEVQFKALADTSPLAIYLSVGIEQRAEYINPTFTRLFGYSQDDVPTVSEWWPLAYPDPAYRDGIVEEWQRRIQQALATQTEIEPMETTVTCKDGSQRIIRWGYQSIGSKSYAFGLDLTELRQAELRIRALNAELETRVKERTAALEAVTESLRAAHAEQQAIFDATRVGIVLADHRVIRRCNRTLEQLFGYAAGEMLGHTTAVMYGDETAFTEIGNRTLASLRKKGYFSEERQLVRKDGSRFWAHLMVQAIEPSDWSRLAGTIEDITERKQAEEQLRLSEERLRLSMEGGHLGAWRWDLMTDRMDWSPIAMAIFGYDPASPPDVSGWRGSVYPDDRERAVNAYEQSRKDGSNYEDQYRIVWPDGSIRWVTAVGRFVGDGEQGPTVMEGICYDITEQKRSEHALRELNANLERKVAQRTAELAAASEAKSQFLANMSHEIRTPMNAVLGLAQLLEKDALTPEQRDMVRSVRKAGRLLLNLISDILDFSKIEAGQLTIERQPFALNCVLSNVAGLLGSMADGKGLILLLDVPTECDIALLGDAHRLEQVLMNLTSNAIKFTDQGSVAVRVIALEVTEPAVRLRFEVQDTGIGISPEQQAILFTPFTQVDSSVTRRFGGTGLGLSICKRLVEQMNGTIGIDSRLGVGSTFWFELPFERTDLIEALPSTTESVAGENGPRLNGLRCLVVDDSGMNRDVVERALRREGAQVRVATDGRKALEILREQPLGFNLVLMDIQMPVMDGLSATRAIRDELGLQQLPVIAFSAGILSDEQRDALDAGMNDFITKPIDLDDLVTVLRRWMPEGASASAELSAASPSAAAIASPFPVISGVDTDRAAVLLGNDREFFCQLLRRFSDGFALSANETRDDLAAGRIEESTRRLHTLRGIAGNIGALPLMEVAQNLEAAIMAGSPDVEALLQRFESDLESLVAAVRPLLEETLEESLEHVAVAPPDPAQLAALRVALREHDLEAHRLFKELRPALSALYGRSRIALLLAAIEGLRFEDALGQLDGLTPTEHGENDDS